ncbi:MAG: 30S ribosomal protein S12 methylthiotransferase RimO [Pseudomonadota bacterium]
MPQAPKVGIVSLGCPKALVDSERIITRLRAEGYNISPSYDDANVVLVNTCGFLDSARDESLEAIGEAMAENGQVIVTGCLGKDESSIRSRFPDVRAVTGPQQYEAVISEIHKAAPPLHDPFLDLVPPQGIKLTPRHYAYLKISEGCNHKCSFCIIPSLRGPLKSRPLADILREAERLAAAGVKELLIISQDTSAYGVDLMHEAASDLAVSKKARFKELVEALGKLGIWVRLHYVYPYPHVDDIIPLMAKGSILPYLDIPFQHASRKVLKNMRRPAHQEQTLESIHRWREICPDLAIRSTFIVGFPGETDEDFETLLSWLKEAKINRAGCFIYENVRGAKANDLQDHVPEDIKKERFERLMEVQQDISASLLSKQIGKTLPVLIDDKDDTGFVGRTKYDAPEIDGCVFFDADKPFEKGDIVDVKISESSEYDLFGDHI